MKDLNANELKVLQGLSQDDFMEEDYFKYSESNKANGYLAQGWSDTSFDNALQHSGLTKNQIKGYLSQLQSKGYIELYDETMRILVKAEGLVFTRFDF